MFLGVFLGCVIGQIILVLLNVQTPRESFVGAFWQSSAVLACWLTMRAADLKRAAAKSDGESTSAVSNR